MFEVGVVEKTIQGHYKDFFYNKLIQSKDTNSEMHAAVRSNSSRTITLIKTNMNTLNKDSHLNNENLFTYRQHNRSLKKLKGSKRRKGIRHSIGKS